MRNGIKAAALVGLMIASSVGLAQWDLTWYVDVEQGGSQILDSFGANLPEGNVVYMLYVGGNGFGDGLNLDGSLVDPSEYVIVLDPSVGGGWTTATIGETDFLPFNPQLDGEFLQTSTLQDGDAGLDVYAIAFDVPVTYSGAGFVGSGYFGVSPGTYTLSGLHGDSWDASGAWQTDQQFVPEPTTVALMIAGLGGVVAYRKKRRSEA